MQTNVNAFMLMLGYDPNFEVTQDIFSNHCEGNIENSKR